MVNTNISKSEKIVANTHVENIVSKFEPPCVPYCAISCTGLNPALAAWARALLTTLDSND